MKYQAVFQTGNIAKFGLLHFHFHHTLPYPNIEQFGTVEGLLIYLLHDVQLITQILWKIRG